MSREKYLALVEEHKPHFIVGMDEVGNGAIAGDLCVAACALPVGYDKELKDSKKYSTEKARKKAYNQVLEDCASKFTFMYSPATIASLGHKNALDGLFKVALTTMYEVFGNTALYLLDGSSKVPSDVPHHCLVKADSYVPAVSAASIIAKCTRDDNMREIAYREWDFAKHKGYPTQSHLGMLKSLGPIRGVHRLNVKTVQDALNLKGWYSDETVRQDKA